MEATTAHYYAVHNKKWRGNKQFTKLIYVVYSNGKQKNAVKGAADIQQIYRGKKWAKVYGIGPKLDRFLMGQKGLNFHSSLFN